MFQDGLLLRLSVISHVLGCVAVAYLGKGSNCLCCAWLDFSVCGVTGGAVLNVEAVVVYSRASSRQHTNIIFCVSVGVCLRSATKAF